MNNLMAALCIAAPILSLPPILRQRRNRLRRGAAWLLQCGVWALVWALWQPPALLPPPQTAALNGEFIAAPASASASAPGRALAPAELAALQSLAVDGDRLDRDALRDLPPLRLRVRPGTAPGWSVDWSRQLNLGEPLRLALSGLPEDSRVTLEDPFGNTVASASAAPAVLTDTPKVSGRWLYRVRIENSRGVHREPLPVIVHQGAQPTVLLWLARPDFDSAALSRWLRQSGVPAQVITRLAPGTVRREALNGFDAEVSDPLDPAGPFDLLILDSHLWPQLNARQRGQLAASKSLLWLVGAKSPRGFLDYARRQGMALATTDAATAASPLAGAGGDSPALQLTGYRPQQLRVGDTQIGGAAPLYWARRSPARSLGFVLFDRSYRWLTAGFAADYARLWKTLFDRQLEFRGGRPPVTPQAALPRAGRRLTLCSEGFAGAVPTLQLLGDDAAPLQGLPAPGDCASYWPQTPGWYAAGDDYVFYVFARDAWPEWQRGLARADTRRMASARLGPPTDAPAPRRPLPRPWIAAALLLLLTFAWWRERPTLR